MHEHRKGDGEQSDPRADFRASGHSPFSGKDDLTRFDESLAARIEDRTTGAGAEDAGGDPLAAIVGSVNDADAELAHISQTLDELLSTAGPEDLHAAGTSEKIEELNAMASHLADTVADALEKADSTSGERIAGHDNNAQQKDPDLAAELDAMVDGVFEDVAVVLGSVADGTLVDTVIHHSVDNSSHTATTLEDEPEALRVDADPPSAELATMDEALAADLDSVMDGGFDTVDDVLNVVFNQKAASLGDAASTVPLAATPVQENQQPPSEGGSKGSAPTAASSPPGATPAAQPDHKSAQPSAEPTPAPSTNSAGHQLPGIKTGSDAVSAEDDEHRQSTGWDRIEPRIRAMLAQLNYPLRLLPAPARTVVDFVALTLVFWVPIVWILAMFIL